MNDTEDSDIHPGRPDTPVKLERKSGGNFNGSNHNGHGSGNASSFFYKLGSLFKGRSDSNLREALEEYIEEGDQDHANDDPTSMHERILLGNILKLRDMSVFDVMIPRADIVAVDINMSQKDLLSLLSEKQNSRLPVYRESLDDVIGTIHMKDILAALAAGERINIESLIRDVPIVSPSMQVLDLLLMMRQLRKHMALVVDEYGGIDGLVTIGDVIEAIVGEIDDEYDEDNDPQLVINSDGSILADGRYDLDSFEGQYGELESPDEEDEVETLGGYLLALAGRVPARGEILKHDSGVVFEIVDADPRRVNRVLIKKIHLLKQHEAH